MKTGRKRERGGREGEVGRQRFGSGHYRVMEALGGLSRPPGLYNPPRVRLERVGGRERGRGRWRGGHRGHWVVASLSQWPWVRNKDD